jgi:hypothetical protein
MSLPKAGRNRVMIDLPPEVHMAIKIRAAKSNMITGAVLCEAGEKVLANKLTKRR